MKIAPKSEEQAALISLYIKESVGHGCCEYHCSGTGVLQEGPPWPRGCGSDPHTLPLLSLRVVVPKLVVRQPLALNRVFQHN